MNRRVAEHAYLDTRVSLLVGQLLHRPQRSRLLEQPYADLAPLLRKAGLASLARELPASPGELEQLLARRLIDEAVLLMRPMNAAQRRFIRHWMRRLELINLKFLLRTRFAREQQPPDLLDLGPLASLPLQTLLATDSVEEFLRQLATTEYGQLAGPARKAYEEQRALFDVEATLDARYYNQLAHLAASLEGVHRQQVESLLRVWLDQVNLVSLLRLRLVYGLSAPHSYFLLAPGGHRLPLELLQELAQLDSMAAVIQHLPPVIADDLAPDSRIEDVELRMQRLTRVQARKVLDQARFNMARAFAYLYLREQQLQLIHTVLKGHMLGFAPDLIRFCGDPLAAVQEGT